MAEISKSGEKVKYRLAEAMKECMKKAPVEKITVKEITEECGVTRQTFYRNFLDKYDLIQLPHHGKLESAQKIFDALEDSYIKEFLVSDNTGSGATSGGSDKLIEYMKTEKMNQYQQQIQHQLIG